MFWSVLRGDAPLKGWCSKDLPWHWSYLISLHKASEAILSDPTLRDLEGEPPPKNLWLKRDELKRYREDRERERKDKARRERAI